MKMNRKMIEALIESGDLLECSQCLELSSYNSNLVTARSTFRLDAKPGEIAHVGASSCHEWECGHCGANNVDIGSPILAEVYTHRDYSTEMMIP